MDRLGARLTCGVENGVDAQIALRRWGGADANRFVGVGDMLRVAIGIGVNGDRLDAHGFQRAGDTTGDGATVCD